MLYSISYDLIAPGKDYAKLWDALARIGAVRILYSQWLVRHTNTTPKALGDYLVEFMDNDDRLFVTEVPSNFAYRGLLAKPEAA